MAAANGGRRGRVGWPAATRSWGRGAAQVGVRGLSGGAGVTQTHPQRRYVAVAEGFAGPALSFTPTSVRWCMIRRVVH